MVDGLKPGQRKILYACFKRNLKSDIKVRRVDAGLNCLAVTSHDPATQSVPWTPPAWQGTSHLRAQFVTQPPPTTPCPLPSLPGRWPNWRATSPSTRPTTTERPHCRAPSWAWPRISSAPTTSTCLCPRVSEGLLHCTASPQSLPQAGRLTTLASPSPGQFGTRLQGGKDAASARYIFTRLAPVSKSGLMRKGGRGQEDAFEWNLGSLSSMDTH